MRLFFIQIWQKAREYTNSIVKVVLKVVLASKTNAYQLWINKSEWLRIGMAKKLLFSFYLGVLILIIASPWSDEAVAGISVNNFTESVQQNDEGVQIYKYEQYQELSLTTQVDWSGQTVTQGQFESGVDDIFADSFNALEVAMLGNYGSNQPDYNSGDWWDDDANAATEYNWRYRSCFDVTNSSTVAWSEQQIYFFFDSATPISEGKMISDMNDLRFLDSNLNQVDFYISDDVNTANTRVWMQLDLAAGATTTICGYYGYVPYLNNPIPANIPVSASSREAVFSYSTTEPIYYVVDDTATTDYAEFASYDNNNDVSVSTYTATLSQYQEDSFPAPSPPGSTLNQEDVFNTTGPILGAFEGDAAGELAPVSAAGTDFVYRMDRYTNEFSFVSPFCNANVEVRNQNNNIVTGGTFTVNQGTSFNFTTTNNATSGIPNDGVVIIEVTNACPVLVSHHSTADQDQFTLYPASFEWYGVSSGATHVAYLQNGTNITVYDSGGGTISYSGNRGDEQLIGGAGQGSGDAIRIVSNNPIGVKSLADGDGTDGSTFLPVEELDYRFYLPLDFEYAAFATAAGEVGTIDYYTSADTCGDGTPDGGTFNVSPSNNNIPGKVYTGLINDSAGGCFVSSVPAYMYYEANQGGSAEDERNAFSFKQNRQLVHPEPSFTVGTFTSTSRDLGSTTGSLWQTRIPITVTNNSASAIDEYQINVDLAGLNNLFTNAQSDGGDIRVAGDLGDGSDSRNYWLESFNPSQFEGNLWFQTGNIAAGGSETYYIYYEHLQQTGPGSGAISVPMEVWLDIDDATTIFRNTACTNPASNNQRLACWADKSGNGNDFINNSNNAQPRYLQTVLNNRGGLSFDGNNDVLIDDDGENYLNGKDDLTVISVINSNIAPTDVGFLETINNPGSDDGLSIRYDSTGFAGGQSEVIKFGSGSFAGTASRLEHESSANQQTTAGQILTISRSTGTQAELYINDTLDTLSFAGGNDVAVSGLEYVRLGEHNQGFWDGYIHEFIIYDGVLTTAEFENLMCGFQDKWGIATSVNCAALDTITTTGSQQDVFTTSVEKPNYYVLDSQNTTYNTGSVIGFVDNTQVSDPNNTQTINEAQIISIPIPSTVVNTLSQTDAFNVTKPLQIGFNTDTTDVAMPISFAGELFVFTPTRGTDNFSIYAPYQTATVEFQQGSTGGFTTVSTQTVTAGNVLDFTNNFNDNAAYKIISDQPILVFRDGGGQDAIPFYPADATLNEVTGLYEVYGVGSQNISVATTAAASVDIYRDDGTQTNVNLNATNSFQYSEGGLGAQGEGVAFRVTSDQPLSVHSVADSDGVESVHFLPKKEFSTTFVTAQDTQYFAIATDDPGVTCRMYDQAGTELTSGIPGVDNFSPQTSGALTSPYPNRIHLGGNDGGDGALLAPGTYVECDEPVYAYFERHGPSGITDETNLLSWPQVRKRPADVPVEFFVDTVNEEGLYFESGRNGAAPQAEIELTVDANSEYAFWRDFQIDTIESNRVNSNGVIPVQVEYATTNSSNCNTASYPVLTPASLTLDSQTTSNPFAFFTRLNKSYGYEFSENVQDANCMRIIITLNTGDEAYTPRLDSLNLRYIEPTLLESQINLPQVDIQQQATNDRRRLLKFVASKTDLSGTTGYFSFLDISTPANFTTFELEVLEQTTSNIVPQFSYPPFPATLPQDATNNFIFDASNNIVVYLTHSESSTVLETIDLGAFLDIINANGPLLSRELTINFNP